MKLWTRWGTFILFTFLILYTRWRLFIILTQTQFFPNLSVCWMANISMPCFISRTCKKEIWHNIFWFAMLYSWFQNMNSHFLCDKVIKVCLISLFLLWTLYLVCDSSCEIFSSWIIIKSIWYSRYPNYIIYHLHK